MRPGCQGYLREGSGRSIEDLQYPPMQYGPRQKQTKKAIIPVRRNARVDRGQRNARQIIHYKEVSPIKPDRQAPTQFYTLPPEIRSIVYSYLLFELLICFNHRNMSWSAWFTTYNRATSTYKRISQLKSRLRAGLPPWLLLSKQFLQDGVAHFHTEATFFHNHSCWYPLKRNVRPPGYLSLDEARTVHFVRNGAIQLAPREVNGTNRRHYEVGQSQECEAITKQAIFNLCNSNAIVRNLKIEFAQRLDIQYQRLDTAVQDIRLSISYFELLPKTLQYIEFTLDQNPYMNALFDGKAVWKVNHAIRAELCRVAKLLLDSTGPCFEEQECARHHFDLTKCTSTCYLVGWRFCVSSRPFRR